MSVVEPVALRLMGTDDEAAPAVAGRDEAAGGVVAAVVATGGQNCASRYQSMRHAKIKNAAPATGTAFSKAAVGFEPTKYRICNPTP